VKPVRLEVVTKRIDDVRRWLDENLPRRAARHGVPGASVAVLAGGQSVESATGVVNLRTGVEVTPDTLFMIQSITKVWTATLVMQLADEGLVELDGPVRAYVPEFRTADERVSAQVTVRHLLTHTGGFEGDLWAATTAGSDALQRFVEDLVSGAQQRSGPGEMYSYCNAGYGVLGRLVEVLRRMPYEVAVRRYLAEPLGIAELAFCADEALLFRTAVGHGRPSPGAALRPLDAWAVMPASNPAAGNQLAMSARALLAFARMHLADGMAPDGMRLLSKASVLAMRERQVDHRAAIGAASGHGLGWSLSSRPGVIEHGGDAIGVTALLRLVPGKGVAVAVLTNGDSAGPFIEELADPLLADLAGVPPAAPLPRPPAGARVTEPRRYAGRYETRQTVHDVTLDPDGRLWVTVTQRNEQLAMAERAGVPGNPSRHELRPVGAGTFVLVDESGISRQAVEFMNTDDSGQAQFLHTGRAAKRTS
jgi:CubicO group peptidase (beta-lactamase class C family)